MQERVYPLLLGNGSALAGASLQNMWNGTWKNKQDFCSSVNKNAQNELAYRQKFIHKLLSRKINN